MAWLYISIYKDEDKSVDLWNLVGRGIASNFSYLSYFKCNIIFYWHVHEVVVFLGSILHGLLIEASLGHNLKKLYSLLILEFTFGLG